MLDEESKAIQEVAKTTGKAIEASEKLGNFFSQVFGEPIKTTVGMLQDKLAVVRWERQLRLADRVQQVLEERGCHGKTVEVSPKLALPIIENATLETDDCFHEMWANLLASAMDPASSPKVRAAFTSIIKDLETVDAQLLELIYKMYRKKNIQRFARRSDKPYEEIVYSKEEPIFKRDTLKQLKIDDDAYESSIDNLMRLRLVTSYIEEDTIEAEVDNDTQSYDVVAYHHGNKQVCMTSLGILFIETCAPSNSEGHEKYLFEHARQTKPKTENRMNSIDLALQQIEKQFGGQVARINTDESS